MRIAIFKIILTATLFQALPATGQPAHRLGVEYRPGIVPQTNRFLRGENAALTPVDRSRSVHLKYAFQRAERGFAPTAYQGVGLAYHTFFNDRELGEPLSLYIFQGARLARLSPRVGLNYEWNFGMAFGWRPYDYEDNWYNVLIGTKNTAYLNANFYLDYRLSRRVDVTAGVGFTHFSNANTKLPNVGLNTAEATLGIVYHFGRAEGHLPVRRTYATDFQPYTHFETLLFGAWRQKQIDEFTASPHTYAAAGFSVAALRNLGRKISLGPAVDGVWDGSANTYVPDTNEFITPSWRKQWALGLAAQVDYAMPYFTVSVGLGANVLHGGGELGGFYQRLALKVDLTRSTFLNIGYSVREFRLPNHLMLGVGVRFR